MGFGWSLRRRSPKVARLLTLPSNTKGRDWVVGDLHGQYQLLLETLESHGFNRKVDRLLSVGDLIDRGPDSPACLRLLDEDWFHACIGNHEWLFIKAFRDRDRQALRILLDNGGEWTREQDSNWLKQWAERLYRELALALELESGDTHFGITHNDVLQGNWENMRANRRDEALDRCLWSRARFHAAQQRPEDLPFIAGVDWVLSGHNPTDQPLLAANQLYIDTHWKSGKLTLVNLESLALTLESHLSENHL